MVALSTFSVSTLPPRSRLKGQGVGEEVEEEGVVAEAKEAPQRLVVLLEQLELLGLLVQLARQEPLVEALVVVEEEEEGEEPVELRQVEEPRQVVEPQPVVEPQRVVEQQQEVVGKQKRE